MSNSASCSSSSSSSIDPSSEITTASLIPGLPNDMGSVILSHVPYSHIPRLKPISKSWRQFLSSDSLSSLRGRRHKNHLTSLVCVFPQDPSVSAPYLLDPRSAAWAPLPPAPCDPNLYGLCNFSAIPSGGVGGGPRCLYLVGGSLFDARSFPLDRPCASPAAFRLEFDGRAAGARWVTLAPMIHPRGSFAFAAVEGRDGESIVVAGGGSRHAMFAAAGTRTCSAERYDIGADRWTAVEGMPEFRAGCVGFLVGREFWVMGGYGESRTISGVFPVDEPCRSVVAMCLDTGKWRDVGDMWGEGDKVRLGKIVVVQNDDDDPNSIPNVYMLDGIDLLRYEIASNRWYEETRVPREAPIHSAFGFSVSDGELLVFTNHKKAIESVTDIWRPRQPKKSEKLYIQIYNPRKKTWRSLIMKSPFNIPVDFNTAVLCNIYL